MSSFRHHALDYVQVAARQASLQLRVNAVILAMMHSVPPRWRWWYHYYYKTGNTHKNKRKQQQLEYESGYKYEKECTHKNEKTVWNEPAIWQEANMKAYSNVFIDPEEGGPYHRQTQESIASTYDHIHMNPDMLQPDGII